MSPLPQEAQQGDHPHMQPPHSAPGHYGAHPDTGKSHVDRPAADPSGAGSDPSAGSDCQGAETVKPPASTV